MKAGIKGWQGIRRSFISPQPRFFPRSPFLAPGILSCFMSLGLEEVLVAFILYCMLHILWSGNEELTITTKTRSLQFTCTFKSLYQVDVRYIHSSILSLAGVLLELVCDRCLLGIKRTRERWVSCGSRFEKLRVWERTRKHNPPAADLLGGKLLSSSRSSLATPGLRGDTHTLPCVIISIFPSCSLACRPDAQGSGVGRSPDWTDLNKMRTFICASKGGGLHPRD